MAFTFHFMTLTRRSQSSILFHFMVKIIKHRINKKNDHLDLVWWEVETLQAILPSCLNRIDDVANISISWLKTSHNSRLNNSVVETFVVETVMCIWRAFIINHRNRCHELFRPYRNKCVRAQMCKIVHFV